jgi:hypothetical protein
MKHTYEVAVTWEGNAGTGTSSYRATSSAVALRSKNDPSATLGST